MSKKPNKPRIGVIITAEAEEALQKEPIQLFLHNGAEYIF